MLAHVAGVPVEEMLPLAVMTGAAAVAATRAWIGETLRRRRTP